MSFRFLHLDGHEASLGAPIAHFLATIAGAPNRDDLLQWLAKPTATAPNAITAALGTTTLSELGDFLTLLDDEAEDVLETLRVLTRSLGDLPTEGATWAWHRKRGDTQSLNDGALSLDLGAEIEFGASVKPASRGANGVPGELEYLLRGQLGLSAGLTAPFSYGSVSVKAKAAGKGELFVFMAAPDSATPVAAAMANDLPIVETLGTPLTLASSTSFRRAILRFEGEIAAAAKASVGLDLIPSNAVSVSVSASGSIEFVRKSQYSLTLERTPNDTLRMKLTDLRLAQKTGELALSATIKPLGLSASAKPYLDKLVQLPEPVEALIEKYGKPSTFIRQSLNDVLKRQGATLQGIAAAISSATNADGLVDTVVEIALHRFGIDGDSLAQFLQGDDIDKLVRRIVDALSISDAQVTKSLTQALGAALSEAAGELEASIRADLATAIQALGGTEIAQALLNVSAAAQAATAEVDKLAARLRDPLINAIRRYRSMLDQLGTAMVDLETKGLTVSMSRALVETTSRECTIDLEFVSGLDTPSIRAAFGAALRGDFRQALAIARQGPNAPGAATIELHDCLLTEIDKRTLSKRAELSVLGLTLSWQQVRSSEIRVVSHGERIEVVTAGAAVQTTSIALGESETLVLEATAAVLRGEVDGGIVYTVVEDDVNSDNVVDRVDALSRAGLIGRDAAAEILKSSELQRDLSKARSLELCIRMRITGTTIASLIAESAAGRLYDTAVRQQVFVLEAGPARNHLQALRKRLGTSDATAAVLRGRGKRRADLKLLLFNDKYDAIVHGNNARLLYLMLEINENAESICDSVENWRGMRALAAQVPPGGAASNAIVDRARTLNERLSRSLEDWARPNGPFEMLASDSLSPWALSYLRTLVELGGAPAKAAVSVTLAWTSATGERLMRAV